MAPIREKTAQRVPYELQEGCCIRPGVCTPTWAYQHLLQGRLSMSDVEATVQVAVRNRIGHLTLNRPEGLNALNLPMMRLLLQQLRAWEDDPNILAVVLRAAGQTAFCPDPDIFMVYGSYQVRGNPYKSFYEVQYALDEYIHTYSKPLSVLMDGLVLGSGMALVQGASIRVITGQVKMGASEVEAGFFPAVGSSYFLPRLPGELGIYLGITGLQARALMCSMRVWPTGACPANRSLNWIAASTR